MDRISDTIEVKDSLDRNVREVQNARQSEITFRLKVEHQNHFSAMNQANENSVIPKTSHLAGQRHSTNVIEEQR